MRKECNVFPTFHSALNWILHSAYKTETLQHCTPLSPQSVLAIHLQNQYSVRPCIPPAKSTLSNLPPSSQSYLAFHQPHPALSHISPSTREINSLQSFVQLSVSSCIPPAKRTVSSLSSSSQCYLALLLANQHSLSFDLALSNILAAAVLLVAVSVRCLTSTKAGVD